jgi:hypothetical protein
VVVITDIIFFTPLVHTGKEVLELITFGAFPFIGRMDHPQLQARLAGMAVDQCGQYCAELCILVHFRPVPQYARHPQHKARVGGLTGELLLHYPKALPVFVQRTFFDPQFSGQLACRKPVPQKVPADDVSFEFGDRCCHDNVQYGAIATFVFAAGNAKWFVSLRFAPFIKGIAFQLLVYQNTE